MLMLMLSITASALAAALPSKDQGTSSEEHPADFCMHCLQALVKHLQGISDDEIPGLHVPIGIPVVYELDNDLNAVRHYSVGENKDS